MMVDMATAYNEVPGEGSHFAQMRDSLYILSVMNQCRFSQCPRVRRILIDMICRSHQEGLGRAG